MATAMIAIKTGLMSLIGRRGGRWAAWRGAALSGRLLRVRGDRQPARARSPDRVVAPLGFAVIAWPRADRSSRWRPGAALGLTGGRKRPTVDGTMA